MEVSFWILCVWNTYCCAYTKLTSSRWIGIIQQIAVTLFKQKTTFTKPNEGMIATKLLINRDIERPKWSKRPFPTPRFRHSRSDLQVPNATYKIKFPPTIDCSILADEHLAELMPIFEQLRAQGNLPCTYPLHVTSSGTAFMRGGSRSTPLSPHAPHCHPSTHWVSFWPDFAP